MALRASLVIGARYTDDRSVLFHRHVWRVDGLHPLEVPRNFLVLGFQFAVLLPSIVILLERDDKLQEIDLVRCVKKFTSY